MKHYIGEIGTDIILDTGVDISSATVLQVKYQKPDGVTGEWTGTVQDTTKIRYTLSEDDIDVAGRWTFQSYVEVSGGKWHGETAEITFAALFDESSFTDLTKVKDMIGLLVTNTDDDVLIERLIMQETKKIQSYTGRALFYGTYTEYYDGVGGGATFIDNYPVDTVTSVHDDLDRVFGSDTLVEANDYYVDQVGGIIRLLSMRFSDGVGNVKVVYLGGFKVIPADLELACSQLVFADYLELKGGMNVLEGETVTYKPSNLRKEAFRVINKYKKLSMI